MENASHSLSMTKGSPLPIGISLTNSETNFALFSKQAHSVTLCIFDPSVKKLLGEFPLTNQTGHVWHLGIKNLPDHFLYGYIIDGRIVGDPYAKCINSPTDWASHEQYFPLGEQFIHPEFNWEERSKRIELQDLIIYEMHVRGFTQDPTSAVEHRGKFLGIIEKIPYLKELGVNAIKLLPIQEFNEKENLRVNPFDQSSLCNYWGYSTVNFFSPMNRYASGEEQGSNITEFKMMVKELHKNGIAVILDIVLNHTAEDGADGPYYSFKGIDKEVYYILDQRGKFRNYTGCGNTLNCNHPVMIAFIIDCLRYWVLEMGVDGFRFDLASIFYRGTHGEPLTDPPLMDAISDDPILAKTLLIAEPWDAIGMYQVGSFYAKEDRWSEWNGKYRDAIRRFMRGDFGLKREFAARICGSQDLYGRGRSPCSSINFVTAHDGFTLQDLVSYTTKYNLANGENNKDGSGNNDSWNCGVEGDSDAPEIIALRERQKRNFILALMISQGIPMIQMGDEYGHTRKGNNNPWCHDNELNWFLWDKIQENQEFHRFYKGMICFRNAHPVLRKGRFLTDRDITWHGTLPFQPDWDGDMQFLSFELKDPVQFQNIYVAFNVHNYSLDLTLPHPPADKNWYCIADTAKNYFEETQAPLVADLYIKIERHSAILLKAR